MQRSRWTSYRTLAECRTEVFGVAAVVAPLALLEAGYSYSRRRFGDTSLVTHPVGSSFNPATQLEACTDAARARSVRWDVDTNSVSELGDTSYGSVCRCHDDRLSGTSHSEGLTIVISGQVVTRSAAHRSFFGHGVVDLSTPWTSRDRGGTRGCRHQFGDLWG